jgi:hypothetical protein
VADKPARPRPLPPSSAHCNVSLQLKLYETTNAIEFVYGAAVASTGAQHQVVNVGIKGAAESIVTSKPSSASLVDHGLHNGPLTGPSTRTAVRPSCPINAPTASWWRQHYSRKPYLRKASTGRQHHVMVSAVVGNGPAALRHGGTATHRAAVRSTNAKTIGAVPVETLCFFRPTLRP